MVSVARTVQLFGGPEMLGEDPTAPDLVRAIRRGIPTRAVEHMIGGGRLSLTELDRIVMPRRTWLHRQRAGRLTQGQSDRLVRLARAVAAAEEAFGSVARADAWLRRPSAALEGERPLDLLDTDEGARRVETLLGRIEHGVAA